MRGDVDYFPSLFSWKRNEQCSGGKWFSVAQGVDVFMKRSLRNENVEAL